MVTMELGRQAGVGKFQERAVKMMTNLKSKSYEGRLKDLGLHHWWKEENEVT